MNWMYLLLQKGMFVVKLKTQIWQTLEWQMKVQRIPNKCPYHIIISDTHESHCTLIP